MRLPLPATITGRLALIFATVILVTLTASSTYLYRALATQLEMRDDAELVSKVSKVRHLLADSPSIQHIEKMPYLFLNAMLGHDGIFFALRGEDDRLILQSAQPPAPFPPMASVPIDRSPRLSDVHDWKAGGQMGRVIEAMCTLSTGERIRIIVAHRTAMREAVLAGYRSHLIFGALAASLIAALLGYLTVRNGLRPIRHVADKTNEITTGRLDTRLKLDETPGELRELAEAFNRMLDRLEDGVKRLTQFSSDISHDLRTPLNALMLKTQVALSKPRTPDDYQELLASNMEDCEHLSRLIENTLFIARAENAQLALHREEIDVSALVRKVCEYYDPLADEARVSLAVSGEVSACADPILLRRAVGNLVSNAVRHASPGGSVRIAATHDSDFVSIAVENTGPGITPDQLGHVFDRYFRADASRAQSGGGAGLGLAIVKAIMKLHEGTVEVCSEVNGPTCFTLKLPRFAPAKQH